MLTATWILAGSTLVLAFGVLFAALAYRNDLADARDRRLTERIISGAADRFLGKDDAEKKFLAKESEDARKLASKDMVVLAVLGLGALLMIMRQDKKPSGEVS